VDRLESSITANARARVAQHEIRASTIINTSCRPLTNDAPRDELDCKDTRTSASDVKQALAVVRLARECTAARGPALGPATSSTDHAEASGRHGQPRRGNCAA